MISGEQDLMAGELNLEQKMCERSPPTLSAEMAEQKGAPVNSKDPPTTAILPFSPFLPRWARSGKTVLSRRSSCRVVAPADMIIRIIINHPVLLATAMDEATDHKARSLLLHAENQYLRSELEEFQFRERSLRKELEIMAQVREECPPAAREVEELRAQVLSLQAEKQQLQASSRNLQEKVNDLKYNIAELKNLNERTAHLHAKQIQMMRKQAAQAEHSLQWQQREKRLLKEKEALEKKLQSCAEIVKEMEGFYDGEIKKLKESLKLKEQDIRSLSRQLQIRTQRMSQGESMKQCNQKWEKACSQMRQEYEMQIKELRNKVKFLINKLQSMQENNDKHNNEMLQSKMAQSNASIDSFRFTPSSSVSSSKQPAQSTRRNTSGMKTNHIVTHKMGKCLAPLAQRNS